MVSNMQDKPVKSTIKLQARLIVVNHPGKLRPGYTPVVDVHTCHVPCKFTRLISIVDKLKGGIVEPNPIYIKQGDVAMVELEPLAPVSFELFENMPSMGRFIVRDLNQVVAIGTVTDVTTGYVRPHRSRAKTKQLLSDDEASSPTFKAQNKTNLKRKSILVS